MTPIASANGAGFWIVDSLTGYAPADQVFRDMSVVRSLDTVAQTLRQQLEQRFVGKKGIAGNVQLITQYASQILANLQSAEMIVAWQTPVVDQPSTNWYTVGCPVQPIGVDKFIGIVLNLQSSSTINLAAGVTNADLS